MIRTMSPSTLAGLTTCCVHGLLSILGLDTAGQRWGLLTENTTVIETVGRPVRMTASLHFALKTTRPPPPLAFATVMRSVFYVALAVAVFAHTNFVAAFTNSDEAALLSKAAPDFANDAVLSTDSRKRFLRASDPDDDDFPLADEERVKWASLSDISKKLDSVKKAPKKVAESVKGFTQKELEAAQAHLKLKGQ